MVALAPLLLIVGCKQSLFDSNVGDDDDDDVLSFDAATNTFDADPNAPDADPNTPDADPDQPDAFFDGPPCPATCQGDAARNHDGTLGGSNGRWRYVSDHRDRTWTQMAIGQHMSIDAMVGTGDPAPAIINCRDVPTETLCAGNTTRLLMVPSDAGAGNADPAVEFTVPSTGAFTMSGDFLAGSAAGNHFIKIYRNTRDDLLFEQLFPTDTTVRTFSVDVEAVAGDRLLFTVEPQTAGMAVPVGFHLFVSEDVGAFPRGCSLTLRFDEVDPPDPALPEDCGLLSYKGRQWDEPSMMYEDLVAPNLVAAPIPELGEAIRIDEGQYMLPTGPAMDFTGDFTIQMWMQYDAFPAFGAAIYSDWDSAVDGGLIIDVSSAGTIGTIVLYPVAMDSSTSFSFPTDNQWHFVRLVRDTSKNSLRFCLDGTLRAGTSLGGLIESSPAEPPYLGRNLHTLQPYFTGSLDDIRVFTRALPCGP